MFSPPYAKDVLLFQFVLFTYVNKPVVSLISSFLIFSLSSSCLFLLPFWKFRYGLILNGFFLSSSILFLFSPLRFSILILYISLLIFSPSFLWHVYPCNKIRSCLSSLFLYRVLGFVLFKNSFSMIMFCFSLTY